MKKKKKKKKMMMLRQPIPSIWSAPQMAYKRHHSFPWNGPNQYPGYVLLVVSITASSLSHSCLHIPSTKLCLGSKWLFCALEWIRCLPIFISA
ncbi:hypothetical protein BJX61DRAFT_28632 [Aspergillus egyptiacus]|nr:hypothetical protein BJX61DRAFT_28632 [Aspergillus egyptiacus]